VAGLPADVGVCTVTGMLVTSLQVEGSDADPDLVPVSGKVRFTPTAKHVVHAGTPSVILMKPIEVELDEFGAFSTLLIATDDADLNPSGWTYTVSFDLVEAEYPTFSMEAPMDTIVDIATVVPVASSDGATITRGPEGPAGPPGPPGGAVLSGWWTYATQTSGPASSGQLRSSGSGVIGEPVTIWLSPTDRDGLDWSLVTVSPGAGLYLRSSTGETWVLVVNSVPGNTQIDCTLVSGTASPPKKNTAVQVSLA